MHVLHAKSTREIFNFFKKLDISRIDFTWWTCISTEDYVDLQLVKSKKILFNWINNLINLIIGVIFILYVSTKYPFKTQKGLANSMELAIPHSKFKFVSIYKIRTGAGELHGARHPPFEI